MSRALKLVGLVWIGLILILGTFAAAHAANNPGRQRLHGHRNARMAAAPFVGEVSDTKQFDISVALPFRNADQLQTFIQQVSDPSSPLYRHYLTNEQFTEAYGPTVADYQSVVNYLKNKGLQVTETSANRMLVTVKANKSDIQRAFHVGVHNYRRDDGTTFFGPDDEPSLDTDTPVLHVSGLNNFIVPHPNFTILPMPTPKPMVAESAHANGVTFFAGSGPSGLLMGKDFRNAYAPGVSLDGTGQSVALFELDTYYPADVQRYKTQAGLTNTVQNVYLDGWSSSSTPGGGNGEVSLDIDQAMAMAPNSVEICYMGPNINNVLNRIATDNICKQISSSWGWGPASSTENQILQQYAAQGQSYFNASGDSGSFSSDPGGNEDDPIQVLVGGTNLNMNGSGTSYGSETGWGGSTGGILTSLAIPAYQTLIPMNNGASTTKRNCPDVGAVASGCLLYANNSASVINVGGTSVAAPTWAGFMALVNQQAVNAGKPTVGFPNPALYQIAQNNYTANFHDITSGSAGTFSAATGYDLVTGIGSPNGQTLINSLSNAAGAPTATATGTPTPVVKGTWRIAAGKTASYTDCQSNVWAPDSNYNAGNFNGATNAITKALPCTTDQALYQNEHWNGGSFTYTFNVPTGSYQVTLKFAELFDGAGSRLMNVSINGTQVLTNFDIFSDAGGQNVADDKVFNNIASSNGLITITVSAASGSPDGNAKIDALQVIPQPQTPTNTPTVTRTPTVTLTPTNTPTFTNTSTSTASFTFTPTITPITASTWRINAGGAAYTDCSNNVWAADENFVGGAANSNTANTVTGTLPCSTDQSLYQTERWGGSGFAYVMNVPNGTYQVTLKFAEIFDSAAGQRIMNVSINGTQVLTNFEVFAAAGGFDKAIDEVFNNIAPVNGAVTIQFSTTASSPDKNAKVDALQIIPQPATPTNTQTSTATKLNTATSTMTSTNTATSTSTNSSTMTSTKVNTSTSTMTSTSTSTLSATPTWTGTSTWTPSFTPSWTGTPSNTPTVLLTNTATTASTSTSTSTAGNTSTSTLTPVPPKNTATSTMTNTAVNTATNTAVNTATSSNTPVNTATSTNTVTSTFSSTPTSTWTKSFTPTATVTNTWTNTFTPVPPTATATNTGTSTFTAVPPTATFSFTPTKTNTPVPPTSTATFSFTPTKTNTPVPPTATWTRTFTPVPPTATPTSASLCSGVPAWNGNFVLVTAGSKVTYNSELYQCIQTHTTEPNWMPSVVPALWKDLGPCSGAPLVVAQTSTVIKSAVAGPNISRNFQPVHFYVQLNQAAQVTVDIFTPLGQRVAGATYFGNSGMNDWLWDVRNSAHSVASSGLYVYTVRVTVNGTTEVKTGKVVLLH